MSGRKHRGWTDSVPCLAQQMSDCRRLSPGDSRIGHGRGSFLARVCLPLLALVWLCLPAEASWIGSARAPGNYRTWTLKAEDGSEGTKSTVSQAYVPLISTFRIGPQVDWVFSTAIASSDWDAPEAAQESVSGNSDLKSQIFYRLLGDRLLLQAGVNIPIGQKALTPEELVVVQLLGHPLLGFRMKHYGEGVNVSGGGAFAFPLGARATLAIGAGFVQRGEYEFVEGKADLKPGGETSVSVGLDFLNEDGQPLTRLDASYRVYGRDESDGEEVFEDGNQLELQAHLTLRPGQVRANLLLRGILKDDNEALTPTGDTVETAALKAGQSIFLRYTLGIAISESSFFGVLGDWTSFSGAEDVQNKDQNWWLVQNEGQAWGLGPVFEQRLGSTAQLGIQALFLRGQIDGDEFNPERDLSGLDVSVQLSWRPQP